MGPVTSISVYFIIWWTVLFMVLPWGVQSHHEAGIDLKDGGDPGAPVNPKIKQKFLITTGVSAVIFAIIWIVCFFHLVPLPGVAQVY
jgi:predicted secreted protein